MSSMEGVAKKLRKVHGETFGGSGYRFIQVARVPTGLFELDLATGGGFPRGCVSELYGPESSCKTTIALLMIAQHQRLWPDLRCVFMDVENSFDPEWAELLGVDVGKLYLFRPDFAEEVVDATAEVLYARDCGLVVVDSLGAMITSKEFEDSAADFHPGASPRAIKKLVDKTRTAITQAHKEDRVPTVMYINQIRYQIGVRYGDPEKTPGGMAPKHQAIMRVRVWSKNVNDAKVSKVLPAAKEISAVVRKWKVKIVGVQAKWKMVLVPHKGLKVGESDNWSTIRGFLEKYGLFAKVSDNEWVLDTDLNGAVLKFPTMAAARQHLREHPPLLDMYKAHIIETMVQESGKVVEDEAASSDED